MKNFQRVCHLSMRHGKENLIAAVPLSTFLVSQGVSASSVPDETVDCGIDFAQNDEGRHVIVLRAKDADMLNPVRMLMNDFEASGIAVRVEGETTNG